jgi:hypothetical protein
MPNPENLTDKGLDKNPQNINRNGRPKGFKGLTETLKDIVESDGSMAVNNIIEIDENGKETGLVIARGKIKIPKGEMIILAASRKAAKGDMKAIEFIFDRVVGKAPQKMVFDTPDLDGIEIITIDGKDA